MPVMVGQVRLEETWRDALCGVQGSGGRSGLSYGTCVGQLVMLQAWLGLKALAWAWPRPGPMYVEEVKW